MIHRRTSTAWLGAMLLSMSAGSALAADAGIEEVIVTAQRTSESIQDVPIAVTALTGEMLEDKGIINPSDLQMTAPNVSFTSTNFGGSSFSIRGIGRLVISASADSGVSTHVNEIALDTNLNAIEFFDVERVEMLRGPQGTLYGRNATGGSINMITRMPEFEKVDGFVDVELGDYEHRRVKGAINIPFSDSMGIRIAGFDLERDGYIDNKAADSASTIDGSGLPFIDDDIDGRDITAYRATFSWDFPTKEMSGCSTTGSTRTTTGHGLRTRFVNAPICPLLAVSPTVSVLIRRTWVRRQAVCFSRSMASARCRSAPTAITG